MTDEDSAEEAAAENAGETGVQDGDFVRVAYTARTVEGGQLVDTTDEEVAEEEGVDDAEQTFEPRVIVLGERHLFDTVEADIAGTPVGEGGSVVVAAEDAFGAHDPDEVRTISADKIPEDDRYPGAHVDIDGEHGHVEAIIGGRARVDFNHPLAGSDIEYEYEVLERVEDRVEQAVGLLGAYVDVAPEMSIETEEVEKEQLVESDDDETEEPEYETVTVEQETLYIESTPQLTMNQQWVFSKQQIAQDLIDRVGVDQVVVREVLDGSPAGPMGGMMGGGMMGGGDTEDALEDADIDAEDLAEELEDLE